ncbi:MAG: hypothetical protein MR902_04245 [Campylobacter sp.]|nr:hypothetical protein [Campylobacter sp.]
MYKINQLKLLNGNQKPHTFLKEKCGDKNKSTCYELAKYYKNINQINYKYYIDLACEFNDVAAYKQIIKTLNPKNSDDLEFLQTKCDKKMDGSVKFCLSSILI